MYILDTNVLRVIFGNRGTQPLLESRIKQTPYEQLYISIVSVEEVLRGTLELFRRYEREQKLPQAFTFVENLLLDLSDYQILPFDNPANERYRGMPAEAKRRGKGDCRIAASALVRGYKVITRNEADFRAIGVACENWFI